MPVLMRKRLLALACVCAAWSVTARAQNAPDVDAAVAVVRTRAAAGHVVAQFTLGSLLYYGGVDLSQAVDWFRRAAGQNYPPAEFQLGQLYDFGFGVEQDDAQALAWYRRAAAGGSAAAQRAVGDFYRTGRAVTKDPVEAARWYRLAADGDDVRAQYQLAQMCLNGDGVPHDYASAYVWSAVAAAQAPLIDNRKALIEMRNIASVRLGEDAAAEAAKRVADWKPR